MVVLQLPLAGKWARGLWKRASCGEWAPALGDTLPSALQSQVTWSEEIRGEAGHASNLVNPAQPPPPPRKLRSRDPPPRAFLSQDLESSPQPHSLGSPVPASRPLSGTAIPVASRATVGICTPLPLRLGPSCPSSHLGPRAICTHCQDAAEIQPRHLVLALLPGVLGVVRS